MNVKRIYHNTSQTLQSELCIQIAGSNNNYIIIQSYSTYIDVMLELEFMLSFSTICFVKIALCFSAVVMPKESNCHLLDVLECVKYIVIVIHKKHCKLVAWVLVRVTSPAP